MPMPMPMGFTCTPSTDPLVFLIVFGPTLACAPPCLAPPPLLRTLGPLALQIPPQLSHPPPLPDSCTDLQDQYGQWKKRCRAVTPFTAQLEHEVCGTAATSSQLIFFDTQHYLPSWMKIETPPSTRATDIPAVFAVEEEATLAPVGTLGA